MIKVDRSPGASLAVSIIVATSCQRLPDTAAAISQLRIPDQAAELIIAVADATGSPAWLRERCSQPAWQNTHVIATSSRDPGVARARGWEASCGDMLLFLDGNVSPDPELISAHLGKRADKRVTVVQGRVSYECGAGTSPAIRLDASRRYAARHQRLLASNGGFPIDDASLANLSVDRQAFEALLDDDQEAAFLLSSGPALLRALISTGDRSAYEPAAIVTYRDDRDFAGWSATISRAARRSNRLASVNPRLKRYLTIGSFHDGPALACLLRQLALISPSLARWKSALAYAAASLLTRAGLAGPALLLLDAVRIELFWSSVRSARGSAANVRHFCSYRARILCYHRVTDQPNQHPELLPWSVSVDDFRRQMQLLARLGYQGISLREMIDAFDTGTPLGRSIVLTFDDGFLDNLIAATPILEEVGFRATIFAVSEFVGRRDDWNLRLGGEMGRLATWEELGELAERGWEIGYHTATHPDLTTLTGRQLQQEIVAGRRQLEAGLGAPVTTMAYPFGRYNDESHGIAAASGVLASVQVGAARNGRRLPHLSIPAANHHTDRFALPRALVEWGDTLPEFALIALTGFPPVRVWKRAACRLINQGRRWRDSAIRTG